MSDTPETDAKVSAHIGFYSCATVPAELCRKLERERDEARADQENSRQSLAFAIEELEEARNEGAKLDQFNEARDYSRATWQSLRDSQDEVLRLTFENRELNRGIDEALILGNKLADQCDRILGLGLHQNTIERFKFALEAWKNYNKMSHTPETDDLARGNHVVPTEWAKQLERERDEAREEVRLLKGILDVLKKEAQ